MLDSTHLIQSITSALLGLNFINFLLLYHVTPFPDYNTISSWPQTYLSVTLDIYGQHSPSQPLFPRRSAQRPHFRQLYHMAVYNIDRLISHQLMANKKWIKSTKIYQKQCTENHREGKRLDVRLKRMMDGVGIKERENLRKGKMVLQRKEVERHEDLCWVKQRQKQEEKVKLQIILISALICLSNNDSLQVQIHKKIYQRQLFQDRPYLPISQLISSLLFCQPHFPNPNLLLTNPSSKPLHTLSRFPHLFISGPGCLGPEQMRFR